MDTNRLKRFATEALNILIQGVVHRLTSMGFTPDGTVVDEPQIYGGGARFMGDTVSEDFYNKWQSLASAFRPRRWSGCNLYKIRGCIGEIKVRGHKYE